ncbi:hypothetical protein [Streptomyces halstedii]|uniref:Uncharacterized protein n=1 Tax=Streptomyces halstedii TaxID=1944 RepID=A0A6N9TV99_STRHA|nr:hypothetical protein [Streptomyces halstedii]NEA15430.1 hypothetical protein [Streptomyces halstedii]
MVISISKTGQNVEPGQAFTIPSLNYTLTCIRTDGDTLILRDNASEFRRPIVQKYPAEDACHLPGTGSWDDPRSALGPAARVLKRAG